MNRFMPIFFLTATLGSSALAIEEPKYEVIEKFETFEIRRYDPMIVAETEVKGDFDEVGNDAFDILAGYIFGKNEEDLKIEMTAPVNQTPVSEAIESGTPTTLLTTSSQNNSDGEAAYLITFVMPSEFTMETLPKPKDERVLLKEMPAKLMAAKSYSGSWSREKYLRHETALMEGLKESGYETVGEPIFARYNSPFTIPLLRRNEVLVEVRSATGEAN
ncbi:MAG: heme-binding protein [Candidatus Omnitrophica bacterium]|nr:heme-binding protein [Candidatus Omnitrophota bacterium]MCA9416528.1 heme-binding protein [Candidatus Omnitrophota bacterium]MCA9429947.1 heme-binding protein [Candidatus Omnitrophota bacterium]MCA9437319.1 heme-binding protein [Candidatus Omnitrophota bacterium]